AKNPVSKRLNQGSRRMVLFPNVISQPSVPNHVILTPAVPGPPLAGGVCAPSATPGSSNDLLQSTVAPATPAARPLPRNRRRETGGCHDVQPASVVPFTLLVIKPVNDALMQGGDVSRPELGTLLVRWSYLHWARTVASGFAFLLCLVSLRRRE